MSLNWKEIDRILEELTLEGAHIRQIFQRDYRNVYVQLFSPAKSCYVRICLEQGHVRLHESESRPPSKGRQPRFSEFLRARIKGGRIDSAFQEGSERIVHIVVLRGGELTRIYLKLWGNAANIIVCDENNTILEAAYRRPKRGECTGEIFRLPESNKEQIQKLDLLKPRPVGEGLSYNQGIAAEYRQKEDVLSKDHLLKELRRYYAMKEQSLSARLARIEKAAEDVLSADRYHKDADIILSQIRKIQRGDTTLVTEDYENPGQEITITLDPSLSPVQNAEKLHNKAKKLHARNIRLEEERVNILNGLEDIQTGLHVLNADPSLSTLKEMHGFMQEEGKVAKGTAIHNGKPGLHYSSQGFQILVGRNAKENEGLLRHFTRGNDIWLHTRDYPGAYVFIKQRSGKSIPLDVLLDAGNLALHYSKAENNGRADLYYTQVKYLRRPRKGVTGLVLPTQEKNLFVQADEKRIKRLLRADRKETHATA